MKLRIYFQTSPIAPLKFGEGYVISSHTLLDVLSLIHAFIQANLS